MLWLNFSEQAVNNLNLSFRPVTFEFSSVVPKTSLNICDRLLSKSAGGTYCFWARRKLKEKTVFLYTECINQSIKQSIYFIFRRKNKISSSKDITKRRKFNIYETTIKSNFIYGEEKEIIDRLKKNFRWLKWIPLDLSKF